MSEYLKVEKYDKVLFIQMCYEKTLNCLNNEMLEELVRILRDFTRDGSLRSLVITGIGRSFCTGADLNAFTVLSQEGCVDYCMDYEEDIFHILSSSRKPTIAAVNGYAIGGGLELALSCDFRIGHEKTSFSAPEYDFGWVPGWGGVHRLKELVGANKAKEILFFKKKIRAGEALQLGLLNEVTEEMDQLVPRALEMAEQLAQLNPLSVTYAKAILDDFNVPAYDSLLQGLTNGITSKSPYAQAKIEAFFNRKKQ